MANDADIETAVKALQNGDVIAYPTEAIYGLGCDPFNATAVAKLLQIKHRPVSKGFILVASHWEQIEPLVEPISPPDLYRVLDTWPGPITWLFPASSEVPDWIRGDHDTVAVRISAHPLVRKLCEHFDGPIVSTSANISGQPPTRDYRTAKITFGKTINVILNGKIGDETKPTTIRDAVTGEVIRAD